MTTTTGTPGNDNIYGTSGNDVIDGGDGNDSLRGGDGMDTLLGGLGNDFLDGGAGDDILRGGEGNDTYVIDSAGDQVIEAFGEGIDTVRTYVNYTLRANLEILQLLGADNLSGNGNELNNVIIGNSGNNHIDGRAGNDSIAGGAGDDVIIGGAGNDYINGGSGIDTASYQSATSGVFVDLSQSLAQETGGGGKDKLISIENIRGSAYDDILIGDAGDNVIDGNGGNDFFRGGAGNDRLFLNAGGEDTVEFLDLASTGVDEVRGFESGVDKLIFRDDDYDAAATFSAQAIGGGAVQALGTGAEFIFDTDTTSLYYDADGAGGAEAVLIAQFFGETVDAGDIFVI